MKTKYLLNGFLILSIIAIIFLSGCTEKETKFVCPDGSVVSDDSLCPKTTLRLGLSYCHVQESRDGPIKPTTPTGIKAGMELKSSQGSSEGVKVKYTVKDPTTNEIIKSVTNDVGTVLDVHQDSAQIDIGLDVFLKEEDGLQVMNTRLPIDIEVSCTNCQTVGGCQGCTDKGLSFTCS